MPFPYLRPGDEHPPGHRVVRLLRDRSATPLYVVEHDVTRRVLTLMVFPRFPEDEPPGGEARFIAAANAGRAIGEEHVARTISAGVTDDVPWMLMDSFLGEDLGAYVERQGALDRDTAHAILMQLGQGLGAMHGAGSAHGGLRPEMVFVEAGPIVRVLACGVARYTVEQVPATSSVIVDRTPLLRWLSPDQTTGKSTAPTAADDVWALGLLAFFMLTGKPYWKKEGVHGLVAETVFDPLPPASERARELGVTALLEPFFDGWFARCVTRAPAERFASAKEATSALSREIRPWEQEIVANPKGSFYDAGLREHADEVERDREATDTDGKTGYRRSTREPPSTEDHERLLRANPKGSFYDRGLRDPRRWPPLVFLALVLLGAILYLLRRR